MRRKTQGEPCDESEVQRVRKISKLLSEASTPLRQLERFKGARLRLAVRLAQAAIASALPLDDEERADEREGSPRLRAALGAARPDGGWWPHPEAVGVVPNFSGERLAKWHIQRAREALKAPEAAGPGSGGTVVDLALWRERRERVAGPR